jgi:hypothetical protein
MLAQSAGAQGMPARLMLLELMYRTKTLPKSRNLVDLLRGFAILTPFWVGPWLACLGFVGLPALWKCCHAVCADRSLGPSLLAALVRAKTRVRFPEERQMLLRHLRNMPLDARRKRAASTSGVVTL